MLACAVALGLIAIALPFEAKSVSIGIKSSTDKGCLVIGFSPVSLTYFSIKVRSKMCPDGETHGFVISEPESAQSNMFSLFVRFQFGGLNWFFFCVISLTLCFRVQRFNSRKRKARALTGVLLARARVFESVLMQYQRGIS